MRVAIGEAVWRHRAQLGRWTGFAVFAGAILRQLLHWPGLGVGVEQLRWLLLTLLFGLFWSAYWRPRTALALAGRPVDFLLPMAAVSVPLLQVPPAFVVHALAKTVPGSSALWHPTLAPLPLLGLSLMAVGDAIALAGMLTLRRSFSVFAEVRELRTGGLYRFVRHPLYLGEIISAWGLALNWPVPWELGCAAAFTGLQLLRARLEERRLGAHHPGYATYATRAGFLLPRLKRPA